MTGIIGILILYMSFLLNSWMKKRLFLGMVYRIEYRDGMDRPEGQLAGLQAKYGAYVVYRIIQRAINGDFDLIAEKTMGRSA